MPDIFTVVTTLNYKDLLTRALWTFVQAFLAVILFGIDSIIDLLFNGDWTGLYTAAVALLIAAVAAGLSALKTIIVAFVLEIRSKSQL